MLSSWFIYHRLLRVRPPFGKTYVRKTIIKVPSYMYSVGNQAHILLLLIIIIIIIINIIHGSMVHILEQIPSPINLISQYDIIMFTYI